MSLRDLRGGAPAPATVDWQKWSIVAGLSLVATDSPGPQNSVISREYGAGNIAAKGWKANISNSVKDTHVGHFVRSGNQQYLLCVAKPSRGFDKSARA